MKITRDRLEELHAEADRAWNDAVTVEEARRAAFMAGYRLGRTEERKRNAKALRQQCGLRTGDAAGGRAMSLTEAERAALDAVCAGSIVRGEFPTQTYESVFLAGLRMGRAEGREQAAKVCDARAKRLQGHYIAGRVWADAEPTILAKEIRALPEEPT